MDTQATGDATENQDPNVLEEHDTGSESILDTDHPSKPTKAKRTRFLMQDQYDEVVQLLQNENQHSSLSRLSSTFVLKDNSLYKTQMVKNVKLLKEYIPPNKQLETIKHYHEKVTSHSGWHHTHAAVSINIFVC